MKLLYKCLMLCFAFNLGYGQEPLVIPRPQQMKVGSESFEITDSITINAEKSFLSEAAYFAAVLKKSVGVDTSYSRSGNIIFEKVDADKINEEGYILKISPEKIVVEASSRAGAFYAVQTIIQMLPAEIGAGRRAKLPLAVPAVSISDEPRFAWRAFMLDEARHFKGEKEVKKLLDQMAQLKMNVFHWHLTDDQGWRVEIKKYPKLTTVGSKRTDTQVGGWGSPKRTGKPHEGFYTQEQIREIVKYAADRHITIVPEIGMPGHASAAIASYPILGTKGKPIPVMTRFGKGVDIFNPARETTYTIISEILDEICELFPSKVIHIGGDEVRFHHWEASEEVKQLMKRESLSTMVDVQTYFINRISSIVTQKGRRIMGWNEIMGDDVHGEHKNSHVKKSKSLSKDAVIHFWKGSATLATKAIKEGYEVVNSQNGYTYLDYGYGGLTLKKAYNFDPVFPGLKAEFHSAVKGFGCQMWGEWIPTVERMEYQVYPRIAAYAEVGWTNLKRKNFSLFKKSLIKQEKRWDLLGIQRAKNLDSILTSEDFFNHIKIGEWSPDKITEKFQRIEFDLGQKIKKPGKIEVALVYRRGPKGLNIKSVTLCENGKEVSKDEHVGFSGGSLKDIVYKLKLKKFKADARYSIKALVKGSEGTKSFGDVKIQFQ